MSKTLINFVQWITFFYGSFINLRINSKLLFIDKLLLKNDYVIKYVRK